MATSIPVEVQRELQAFRAKIDELLQKALSGKDGVTVANIQQEIMAYQQRINVILDRWRDA
jgi:peptidoglycan hydrolase CwlO-like protein